MVVKIYNGENIKDEDVVMDLSKETVFKNIRCDMVMAWLDAFTADPAEYFGDEWPEDSPEIAWAACMEYVECTRMAAEKLLKLEEVDWEGSLPIWQSNIAENILETVIGGKQWFSKFYLEKIYGSTDEWGEEIKPGEIDEPVDTYPDGVFSEDDIPNYGNVVLPTSYAGEDEEDEMTEYFNGKMKTAKDVDDLGLIYI